MYAPMFTALIWLKRKSVFRQNLSAQYRLKFISSSGRFPTGSDMLNKIYGLIGLAKRAGMAVCGENAVKESVRFGKAVLVLIAADVSENTRKNITDSCKYYNVTCRVLGTMDELGHAVGNNFNAAVAITDKGFSKSIQKHLQANINGGEML